MSVDRDLLRSPVDSLVSLNKESDRFTAKGGNGNDERHGYKHDKHKQTQWHTKHIIITKIALL